jgi:CRP-like cAMP-binding protein
VQAYYLVDQGSIEVIRGTQRAVLGPGALVGEFDPGLSREHHGLEVVARSPLEVYRIEADEMRAFFGQNPGTLIRLAKHLDDTLRQGTP